VAATHAQQAELAKRYARALFDLAETSNNADAILTDLQALRELVTTHQDIRRLMLTPAVSPKEKQQAWAAIADKLGTQAATKDFLTLLGENHRLSLIPAIADAFKTLVLEAEGKVEATAITAAPLTKAQAGEIEKQVAAMTGKNVILTQDIDPDILGGLVLRIGSVMIDHSLRHQLDQLKQHVKSASAGQRQDVQSLAA